MKSLLVILLITIVTRQCFAFLSNFGRRSHPKFLNVNQDRRHFALHLTTADFKNGMTFEVDGVPMRLQEFLHVKPGKGAAFVRTKIKNLVNGSVLDRTFRAGESIILADVTKTEMQYTYTNGGLLYFMNMETFEEQSVDAKKVSNVDMLIEGLSCSVCQWDDRVIDVQLPLQVVYTVVETDPTLKSKEQGTLKAAKLDSGATINVPMFIDNGEQILVSTEDRKYLNRANGKSFS